MTTKKKIAKATVVPVLKQKIVVANRLGTRESAEFEEELRALFERGYKVVNKEVSATGVRLTLAITEEWSWEEFVADLREHMPRPAAPTAAPKMTRDLLYGTGLSTFRSDFP